MSSEPTYDLAMEHLEECIKALHMNAVAIVDEHWAQILEHENKARSWQEKSQLQLACHRKGNNIQIKWIGTKWYGKASSRRSVRTNIARGAGELTYSMAKLREWTREWEAPIVEETERKLTSIRRQAQHVVKAIMALRHAKLVAAKHPIDGDSAESPEET